jgi:hypothetical protein
VVCLRGLWALQAAATPQQAAEWLPEAWAAAAESLRANSVRVCACVVGGPDEEGTPGAYALDAGFARAYAALAAVTGGLVRTRLRPASVRLSDTCEGCCAVYARERRSIHHHVEFPSALLWDLASFRCEISSPSIGRFIACAARLCGGETGCGEVGRILWSLFCNLFGA